VDEEFITVDPPAAVSIGSGAPVIGTADEFLSNDTMPTDHVFLPVQRKRMKIRGIRSRERAELEKRLEEVRGSGKKQTKETNLKLFREWLIVYGAIRPDGSQMFGTEHIGRLQNMASGDINAIAEGVMKLSGIGEQEVDDMVGNSDASPSGSSPGT
jgi:hypothetical protein